MERSNETLSKLSRILEQENSRLNARIISDKKIIEEIINKSEKEKIEKNIEYEILSLKEQDLKKQIINFKKEKSELKIEINCLNERNEILIENLRKLESEISKLTKENKEAIIRLEKNFIFEKKLIENQKSEIKEKKVSFNF